MGTRRQSGEGSIYPYPHGFRAYVWVTTSTGRRQRKYVSGKTRDEVREKYLARPVVSRQVDGSIARDVVVGEQIVQTRGSDVVAEGFQRHPVATRGEGQLRQADALRDRGDPAASLTSESVSATVVSLGACGRVCHRCRRSGGSSDNSMRIARGPSGSRRT
jgi:hypothetical protein